MLFPSQTQIRSSRENTLHVWKPTPNLRRPMAALRSHRYSMDDDFVGTASDIFAKNVTGREDATRHLLNEARSRSVISFGDRPDALFDYNPFNDMYKFVLILNKFPGDSGYANYTVVLTGICEGEPVLRDGRASDRCNLVVQHRTVIQSYQAVGPRGGGSYSHHTRSDTSFLYGNLLGNTTTRPDLFENRPASFNYVPGLGGMADEPLFSGDPLMSITSDDYGAGGVAFNRFDNSPDVVMRNVVDTVSKSLRRRNASGGYGNSEILTTVHDPLYDVSNVADEFMQADRQGGTVTAHLGPATNSVLPLMSLTRDYGIEDIYMATPAQDVMYTDEDPTEASTKNTYYGLLESLLPAFAASEQIITMFMEVKTELGDFGRVVRVPRLKEADSYIEDLSAEDVAERAYRVFDKLEAAVFEQISATVGAFELTIDLNLAGESFLHLTFLDERGSPDAVYSFTSGWNNFAVPLVAQRESVRDNQRQLGNMLHRVFSDQSYDTQSLLDLTATSEEDYDYKQRTRQVPPRIHREPGIDTPPPRESGRTTFGRLSDPFESYNR